VNTSAERRDRGYRGPPRQDTPSAPIDSDVWLGHGKGAHGADGAACGTLHSVTQREPSQRAEPATDLGHRGDVDRPQIEAMLRLTPTERLRKHEGWRLFVKKALADAELRRAADRKPR
jgi:hypothetical protein